MTKQLPHGAQSMADRHAEVWRAFTDLGAAVAEAGPLDPRTRRLVKLALTIAAGSEGGTHSHVRRACDEGIPGDVLRHVALLAIPTIGFPAAVKGMTWIDDILSDGENSPDLDSGDMEAAP